MTVPSPAISAAVLGLTIGPATFGGLVASAIAWTLKGTHASHASDAATLAERRSSAPFETKNKKGEA